MNTPQHVLILGLGDSGLAMARWCARRGDDVQVWDSRSAPPQAAALAQDVPGARLLTGTLGADALAGVDLLLKSPGLAPLDERIAPLLAAARAAGVPVRGELNLFAQALAELKAQRGYDPKLLAITGTNGKTTTTALTDLLVARCGLRVASAGNIGPTLLDTLTQALASEALPEVWVLELSSFQLDALQADPGLFQPSAAVVLNLSQDHLDWHGSMAAYAQAKSLIYGQALGQATLMVINRDDAAVTAMVPAAPALLPGKGRAAKAAAAAQPSVVSFGLDAPTRPGDYGLLVERGMAWLVRAQLADDTPRRAKDEAPEIFLQRLMPVDALRMRGRHNAANALAALALASAIGCALAPMLHGLRDYAGEPHRVQFVASLDGVEAFDDSKGTNVGATVAAVLGLGADKAPGKLLLILGGDGKGQDFAPLAAPLARHARAAALIGRDAAAIASAIAPSGIALQHHATLEAATRWCFAQAQPGDAVLLSPACASLDMFRNYAHRAEVFVATVQALAHERGLVS